MADLSAFPITARWPAQNPDVIQLYAFPTPNGVKVSIALEELALPYEAHNVTLASLDVKSPEFLSLNPNGKIPAIIDPDGPDGQPVGIFESGAILIYLAEKTGRLIGATPTGTSGGPAMADVPDGRHRADVRAAWLFLPRGR
jgi:GST-like protein